MSTPTRIKRLPSIAATTSSTSMDVTGRSSRVEVLQVFSGPHLAQLEIEASDAKRGLWQDPTPIPLWVFRKRQRGQSVSRDEMSCFPIVPAPREGVQ